ncbi:TrmB family transcriptional regulator [Pseudotabrizicola algicola]|uniref:TrmB family transcriptional regulator n=1 Tax=Pseudotabrizicola algicola TaxID=2709381 RepID=A0A6B3RR36_9RHOB|nr:TrmB family transcriptional regulator [Pseudotabrizicola algicola]NEX48610.1 TrmB family transcriptional regulator [Pseudotabrizicola algicola]
MSGNIATLGVVAAEVLSDLRALGFTDYEAKVYIQLLRQSPATAYEVSKNAGVPRPNTYNALESLAQRGVVLPVSEAPARYVAAPPDQILNELTRRTSAICDRVSARLAAMVWTVDDQYVWTLSGEDQVHAKIDALIDGTEHSLMVKAASDILFRHKPALQRAGNRGVEMLIVLFGPDAEEFRFGPACKVYIHEGNGVRMGKTDNLFTIATDHNEMVTATIQKEVVAVHTRNGPIVTMAESLIRHDFYMAEIFARFGDQIDDAFGPYLRDLRLACFTEEQAESFKKKTGLA